MIPRTKRIKLVYHHFREHVHAILVGIHHIYREQQFEDIFTKKNASEYLCKAPKDIDCMVIKISL